MIFVESMTELILKNKKMINLRETSYFKFNVKLRWFFMTVKPLPPIPCEIFKSHKKSGTEPYICIF